MNDEPQHSTDLEKLNEHTGLDAPYRGSFVR